MGIQASYSLFGNIRHYQIYCRVYITLSVNVSNNGNIYRYCLLLYAFTLINGKYTKSTLFPQFKRYFREYTCFNVYYGIFPIFGNNSVLTGYYPYCSTVFGIPYLSGKNTIFPRILSYLQCFRRYTEYTDLTLILLAERLFGKAGPFRNLFQYCETITGTSTTLATFVTFTQKRKTLNIREYPQYSQ